MEINLFLAAAILLLIILMYVLRRSGSAQMTTYELKISLAKAEERSDYLRDENESLRHRLDASELQLRTTLQELERSRSYFESQQEKLKEQRQEIQTSQEKLNKDFELIASRILEEKTKKFTEQNRMNMDTVLNPLRENIKLFEEKVEKVYKAESDERNVLKGHISQLIEQSNLMSLETQNLTRALKGDNKKQGNWGEIVLERILERSGLTKDQEYRIQSSYVSADGLRSQPDVIIDLPDNKHLVIDAKVSLLAYERFVGCEDEGEAEGYIKQHIASLKGHVAGLAAKNYADLYQIDSPEFVLLFVPIESCFSIAVQRDAELFSYAWEKRVVIVSPSTLLATLRTIASIWKQERQNRNVLEIARLSGEMYDKFVGFIGDMEGIGKSMKSGQDAFDRAMNKLSSGRGNLTVTAEKVKKLGAKAGKQIDQKFIGDDDISST